MAKFYLKATAGQFDPHLTFMVSDVGKLANRRVEAKTVDRLRMEMAVFAEDVGQMYADSFFVSEFLTHGAKPDGYRPGENVHKVDRCKVAS